MRVTNGMIQRASLVQLQSNMQGIADAERRVSTGKRLLKASDDPTAAAGSIRTRVELRAVEHYRRSAELAQSRTMAEENVLLDVTDLLSRARMLATGQATDTANTETRLHTKAEIDQIFRQVLDLANTKFEGGYLFGGVTADERPYAIDETDPVLDFTSTTPSGQHAVQIGEQRFLATNHNGVEVFEDTAVFDSIRELAQALEDDDLDAVNASIGSLEDAFDGVQDLIGDVGARTNQLDITLAGLDTIEVNLKEFKSNLEEVEFEEAATELVSRTTAMQAAMLATSRVMGLSLANYL